LRLGCQIIVLSDSPLCSEPFCSTYQSRAEPYLITLLPVCIHPGYPRQDSSRLCLGLAPRSQGRSLGHLFRISTFQFQAVNGYINILFSLFLLFLFDFFYQFFKCFLEFRRLPANDAVILFFKISKKKFKRHYTIQFFFKSRL